MDKTNSNGLSSKPSESGGQRKQLPYSVETPYGFHLDLDFLKYVDDIEKGNTIKRVHIQRRAKGPKFSTLPRNFSLPDHGSKSAPKESWSNTCSLGPKTKSRVLEVQQIFEFRPADSVTPGPPRSPGLGYRTMKVVEDATLKTFDEQPLGFRVRPQLLRASSMPVTVLQRKNSEPSEDTAPPATPDSFKENGSSENVFCSSDSVGLGKQGELGTQRDSSSPHQQFASVLQRIKELEEQVRTIPELKRQICTLREEKGQLELKLNSQPVVVSAEEARHTALEIKAHYKEHPEASSSSAVGQLQKTTAGLTARDVSVGVTESDLGLTPQKSSSDTDPLTIITLRTKLTVLEKELGDATRELERANSALREQTEENGRQEERIKRLMEEAEARAALGGTVDTVESKRSSEGVSVRDAAMSTDTDLHWKSFSHTGVTTEADSQPRCDPAAGHTEKTMKDLRSSSVQTDSFVAGDTELSINVPAPETSVESTIGTCEEAAETTEEALMARQCVSTKGMRELTSTSYANQAAASPVCREEESCFPDDGNPCQPEGVSEVDNTEPHPPGTNGSTSSQAAVGQYVTKIQELLQEQWSCLENGHPELASTLKQPASKISSIQNQLFSSLNALSSMYSSQEKKESVCGSKQQAALKSIMKKKDCSVELRSAGAKKNLKFVGVNGGYETTSSEESSSEDNVEDDSSEAEEREEGDEAVKSSEESSGMGHRSLEASEPGTLPQAESSKSETVDEDFISACHFLQDHLAEVASPDKELRQVLGVVCQEWFRVSSQKASQAHLVSLYLRQLEALTLELREFVVNLADGNGNTALHYSVSHSNFRIVKLLLGTGLCKVNHQNKAGYTAIMLASLTAADSQEDMDVALQLLKQGDINTRASQGETEMGRGKKKERKGDTVVKVVKPRRPTRNTWIVTAITRYRHLTWGVFTPSPSCPHRQAGQTALMLAVSHGRVDMVRLLLMCDADVNIQDQDGSTALMCACEHGHTEIARLLLGQPTCDTGISDNEGNTALSVALQSSHTEIADLLMAHADRGAPDAP
ncbi:KN motif and ankyrin repeat domain-containing protein 4 isoform X2 [Amia ocellicauda]|uniref:KN motif and ankyrin repeat domain-containing protein 4 isoform X2 n=1 Tax=Amia ocellicauda TaxID=2972642 RepID=UPI003464797A